MSYILEKALEQLRDHHILTREMDDVLLAHIDRLAKEVDRLSGKTGFCANCERLAKDNENMLWNLVGCSTFAIGYGIHEPYAENLAHPAMKDVLQLALKSEAQESTLRRYREALERIAEYWNGGEGSAVNASGTMTSIANLALSPDPQSDEKENQSV